MKMDRGGIVDHCQGRVCNTRIMAAEMNEQLQKSRDEEAVLCGGRRALASFGTEGSVAARGKLRPCLIGVLGESMR